MVGAPIKIQEQLFIGAFIILPSGAIKIFTKQFLHTGEEKFYANSFEHNPQIKIGEETISFAISADIDNQQQGLNAKNDSCSLYIASIFFSKNGIEEGHKILAKYAHTHSMSILMTNYTGMVRGLDSGRKSVFWNHKGKQIAALETENQGLLIIEKRNNNWINIPDIGLSTK